jgi:cell wall-associated NlpC family hydrolase
MTPLIAKGREFVRTPYLHQGRVKGRGIDCIGLVLMSCQELGMHDVAGAPIAGTGHELEALDPRYRIYPEFPADEFIHQEFKRRAIEKPIEKLAAGDLVTLRILRLASHCGIVSDLQGRLGLIHCYRTVGKVTEHVLDGKWQKRIAGVFSLPKT